MTLVHSANVPIHSSIYEHPASVSIKYARVERSSTATQHRRFSAISDVDRPPALALPTTSGIHPGPVRQHSAARCQPWEPARRRGRVISLGSSQVQEMKSHNSPTQRRRALELAVRAISNTPHHHSALGTDPERSPNSQVLRSPPARSSVALSRRACCPWEPRSRLSCAVKALKTSDECCMEVSESAVRLAASGSRRMVDARPRLMTCTQMCCEHGDAGIWRTAPRREEGALFSSSRVAASRLSLRDMRRPLSAPRRCVRTS